LPEDGDELLRSVRFPNRTYWEFVFTLNDMGVSGARRGASPDGDYTSIGR
jgi:hypothetical protein